MFFNFNENLKFHKKTKLDRNAKKNQNLPKAFEQMLWQHQSWNRESQECDQLSLLGEREREREREIVHVHVCV